MTTPADPFIAAALDDAARALEDIRACIDDAPPEALNWRPAGDETNSMGDETNSIAVLAVHSLASTRAWLSVAVGTEPPPRDRPAEFKAEAADTAALLAQVDEIVRECAAMVHSEAPADWAVLRKTHVRPNPDLSQEVSAAWALVHAVTHLREHAGQMLLTLDLWEASAGKR